MEQKTKIIAEPGQQDLTILREFDLPVELLYKAYAEAEFVEQWMGTKVVKLDHQNHGSFQFETSYNGNIVFRGNGTIHKVLPNQQIIRTFEMENAAIGVQLEFLEFQKITEDTSILRIHIVFQSEQHRAKQLEMPFAMGLNMAHNKLQELFKN